MSTLILNAAEVRDLLSYPVAIERMEVVLRSLARGHVAQPPRTIFAPTGSEVPLGMMPGYVEDPPTLGLKSIAIAPANRELGRPAHQGVVTLFDPTTGEPIALVEASMLTEIRTAAVSAVATRALARPDASTLGILGSGAQARAHALAIPHVRPIRRILLFDRRPERARALATEIASRTSATIEVGEAAASVVRASDIVCSTTASREPWLAGSWLTDGAHLNAVGAATKGLREWDEDLLRARVFVDHRPSAWEEAEELRRPRAEGRVGPEVVLGELGEVLEGMVDGRTDATEVTAFKSVGLACEDIAAARYLFERAAKEGRGVSVDLAPPSSITPFKSTSLGGRG